MLRKGFTLAEVLIALLLVGILSSISIQTLRNRDNTAEYEAIRNKAMTNVQGVLHEALYAKSSSEIFGDETTGNYKEIMDFLNNRLGAGTATISGKDFGDGSISAKGQKMRDGSYYALTAKSGGALVAELTIDVNGDKAPNKEGTDIFKYNVDKFGGVLLSSISGSETEKSCKEKDPTKPFMWKDGSCHACPENIPNLMSDGSCQSCTSEYYHHGGCKSCTSDYYHHGGCQSCPSSQWDNEKNACCKLVNGVCEKQEECTGDLVKINGTCQCPATHPVKSGDECFFQCEYSMSRVPVLAKNNSECPVKCDDGTIAPTQADCKSCTGGKELVNGKCQCPSGQEEVTITFRGKTTTQCLTKCAQGQIRNLQNGMCESECYACTRAEMRSGKVMCCHDKLKCEDGSTIDISRVDAKCPEEMDNGQRYCCDCTRPWIRGNACLEGNSTTSDCEAHCGGGANRTPSGGGGGGGITRDPMYNTSEEVFKPISGDSMIEEGNTIMQDNDYFGR